MPGFGVDPETIVVGGFGNGASMAHQLHIIFSNTIKGAGLISGGAFLSLDEELDVYLDDH